MLKRVLTALAVAPVVLAGVFWSQPWIIFALCFIFFGIGAHEYYKMLRAAGHAPLVFEGLLLTLAFVTASLFTNFDGIDVLFAAGVAGILASALIRRMEAGKILVATAGTLFGALYAGYLGGFVVRLKAQSGEWGKDLLLLTFFLVWSGDSFAMWSGMLFGKTPLAPSVSPKKTWEGVIGGTFGSLLVAAGMKLWAIHKLRWADVLIITLIVAVFGVVGDLCESMLKRASGIKDSGGLLPGHGGILDRLDSTIFAAPAVYYYFHFVLQARENGLWERLLGR